MNECRQLIEKYDACEREREKERDTDRQTETDNTVANLLSFRQDPGF